MSTTAERVETAIEMTLEPQPIRPLARADHQQPQHAPSADFNFPPGLSSMDRFAWLVARGVTPELLDRYLAVQQKYEAEQARRSFVKAMAKFKSEELKPIKKKKRVRVKTKDKAGNYNGEYSYMHETLDAVVNAVTAPMARCGLSHGWKPHQDRQTGMITVRCTITHEDGHSEFVELFGAPDSSGQKNDIQQVASTVRYLQRYTLELITGVAAEDDLADNDGRPPQEGDDRPQQARKTSAPRSKGGDGKATEKQQKLIGTKLSQADIPERELLEHFKIGALVELPFDSVNAAFDWIKERAANG